MAQLLQKDPNTIRQQAQMSIDESQALLTKSYLHGLANYKPMLFTQEMNISTGLDVRVCKVERIVLENRQSVLESLTATYAALGSAGYSAFLLLKSNGEETDVYLGVRGYPKQHRGEEAGRLLEQAFKGHFPGSQLVLKNQSDTQQLLFGLRNAESGLPSSVTAVTGVPSLSIDEREHFAQGLEKFINAAEGKVYQALILAEPINGEQLDLVRLGYEATATQLSPLLKQTLSFGQNESDTVGLSLSYGISQSLATSVGLTETHGASNSSTHTVTKGTSESRTNTVTNSTSSSTSGKSGLGKVGTLGLSALGAIGGVVLAPMTGGASLAFSMAAAGAGMGAMVGGALFDTHTKGTSHSESTGTTTGTSYSESTGTTTGTSYSSAQSKNKTDTYGTSFTNAENVNQTVGSSRQISLETTDKQIEQILLKIDKQLERLQEAYQYGGWHSGAYFIADNSASSRALGSIFLGLMRGNDSHSENFALTTWQSEASKLLLPWLSNLTHPRLMSDLSKNLGIPYLTPATLVSGKEMALQLALPRHSTSTVTVVEATSFGRRIQSTNLAQSPANRAIKLGRVRHLWTDLPQKIMLDVDKLSGHLFITGATGSGKSNTVYHLLNELGKQEVKFLIIEPAKGEYKHIFGNRSDVKVFGTNPNISDVLKINPFKFPSMGNNAIHVLEHIDRLIEIFSMCWSMYDAMPAMLKQALLKAYELSGWDLDTSVNSFDDALFPSFIDLLQCLESEIDKSNYSAEIKSNYKGALITRVASLTTGLNKQLFSTDEIDDGILFDENVIVDLSRVGSQETKSLIMGILVLRLSEYRMTQATQMNTSLKHITVLEEAHNLLRSHTAHSEHGSNIAGKSVELLSNAIAEMRTFGEGFIIADQSPNAVDISAIRNTNTKIIMRLPDEADYQLIGRASGLTDEQLPEIAKLPQGVAVVYQNDWLEPILCKVSHYHQSDEMYCYQAEAVDRFDVKKFNQNLARLIFNTPNVDLVFLEENIDKVVLLSKYKISLKTAIQKAIKGQSISIWSNEVDKTNLLLSVLGVRENIIDMFDRSDSMGCFSNDLENLLIRYFDNTNEEVVVLLKDDLINDFCKDKGL